MIYHEDDLLELARRICREAHAGQTDKAGQPYYLHPFAVADMVDDVYEKCVAYLHDVVEDTDYTLDDLTDAGFPDEVVSAVDAITRREGEGYFDFIVRCGQNDIARTVKLADLSHNTDPSRADSLPQSLAVRYEKAKDILDAMG